MPINTYHLGTITVVIFWAQRRVVIQYGDVDLVYTDSRDNTGKLLGIDTFDKGLARLLALFSERAKR